MLTTFNSLGPFCSWLPFQHAHVRQSCRSGCLIHNGTYLMLSLTLTITLTILTLTVTVRVTLTLLTLPTLILDTVVNNKAPTSAGSPVWYAVTRAISAPAHPHYTHGPTVLVGTFQRHCETTSSVYVSTDHCVTETFIHLPFDFVTYKFSNNNNGIINAISHGIKEVTI